MRVSRHGDRLVQRICIERLGGSSVKLRVVVVGDDGTRVEFTQVLVCTSLSDHKPQAFPDDLRAALERSLAAQQETTT